MKISFISSALAATVGIVSAAPAIVWKSGESSSRFSHISDSIDVRSLLSSSVGAAERDASALAAVIFLVGRDSDGSEGLASLASSGKIPGVQEKYQSANEIHHHVRGVESSRTVARDARQGVVGASVAEVSMEEFQRKLSSMAQTESVEAESEGGKVTKVEQKRRRTISEADVLVVSAGTKDAAKIDSAIVAAIESPSVSNVVLSSIRSTDEVKRARKLAMMSKFSGYKKAFSGRRLEDEAQNENNQNNNNGQGQEGVYYVNMTPNIFSGLLFFFMFVFTAHLGLTCMNMIEGQDVYVKKMPVIGREV